MVDKVGPKVVIPMPPEHEKPSPESSEDSFDNRGNVSELSPSLPWETPESINKKFDLDEAVLEKARPLRLSSKQREKWDLRKTILQKKRLQALEEAKDPKKQRRSAIRRLVIIAARQELAKQGAVVPVRQPLENPRKKHPKTLYPGFSGEEFDAERTAARFAKIVPFERFNANLQIAFGKALARIKSSPKGHQYIMVGDQGMKTKSTTWVTQLVSGQLDQFRPQAIVKPDDVKAYLHQHTEVKHVVLIDDGAYSGLQMAVTLGGLPAGKDPKFEPEIHVVVPYMTQYARKRLLEKTEFTEQNREGVETKKYRNIHLYSQERMLSYEEIMHGEEKNINASYTKYRGVELVKTRTPTWMAHKASDDVSTDYYAMEKITHQMPVSPYNKVSNFRQEQIARLKREMGEDTLEFLIVKNPDLSWLKKQLHFVRSNRGSFLVANKYVEGTEPEQLELSRGDEKKTLGGPEGQFQIKLKEGEEFTLKSLNGSHEVQFKLSKGKLEIIRS